MSILDEARKGMKARFGMTDKEFEKHISYPHNRKIVENMTELQKYKMIAEVVETKYCSAGMKKGQKLVFNLMPNELLPAESNAPLCLRAIGPIAYLAQGFWDRIIDGLNPNEGVWHIAECLDQGLEKGGLGHVVFKVHVEK